MAERNNSLLSDIEAPRKLERRGALPFSETPFIAGSGNVPSYEPVPESDVVAVTLRVKSVEAQWSDLLLDVAMTTTFSSLTDGTEVTGPLSALSYLVYFALVWWIWASQVAYNVRFRTSDWVHRIFVFLQFLIFCALAAFTREFDIASGIRHDKDEGRIAQLQRADFFTDDDINVTEGRANLLDRLNSKGIAVTMGLSRLLLLVQYVRVIYYAKGAKRQSLFLQCGIIAASSFAYFLSSAFVEPTKGNGIVKIILWCLPLVLEVLSHFAADRLPGRTGYKPDAMYERAATVFVIILGGGLDKITEGFRFIAGNVSFGSKAVLVIFCGAIIFITQYSSYFGTREDPRPGDRRILAWFFAHFFYLSALMLTLQGVAALLLFGNISNAIDVPVDLVTRLNDNFQRNDGLYVNETQLEDLRKPLEKLGISLTTVAENINFVIDNFNETTVDGYILQMGVSGIVNALDNLDAFPDEGSLLAAQIFAFQDNDATNTTIVNQTAYADIIEGVLAEHDEPALWFFAVAGLTFLTLTGMGLLVRWPTGQYEWWVTSSRLVFGVVVVALSVLDMGQKSIEVTTDGNPRIVEGAVIETLARHSLVLPILAILLIVEQGIEVLAMIIFTERPAGFGETIVMDEPKSMLDSEGIPTSSTIKRSPQSQIPFDALSQANQ